jgi:hypothetical protein
MQNTGIYDRTILLPVTCNYHQRSAQHSLQTTAPQAIFTSHCGRMISSLHSGISKVIRTSGQALDSLGKKFELHPYTDRREFCMIV